jgi:hypothetical protein
VAGPPDRHRIALEVDVDRGLVLVEPAEWDVDDLLAALREGAARPVRVVRGRVVDEEHDPLSATLDGLADDLARDQELHWMASASPDAVLRPEADAPRPSLESLVELRELTDHLRRVAERLRSEGL